jgi:hypothetical protein
MPDFLRTCNFLYENSFLPKPFLRGILSPRYVDIFEISVKLNLDLLISILAYLKGKNFDPYIEDFLLFCDQKCHLRNEPLNIQKNVCKKFILLHNLPSGSKST